MQSYFIAWVSMRQLDPVCHNFSVPLETHLSMVSKSIITRDKLISNTLHPWTINAIIFHCFRLSAHLQKSAVSCESEYCTDSYCSQVQRRQCSCQCRVHRLSLSLLPAFQHRHCSVKYTISPSSLMQSQYCSSSRVSSVPHKFLLHRAELSSVGHLITRTFNHLLDQRSPTTQKTGFVTASTESILKCTAEQMLWISGLWSL